MAIFKEEYPKIEDGRKKWGNKRLISGMNSYFNKNFLSKINIKKLHFFWPDYPSGFFGRKLKLDLLLEDGAIKKYGQSLSCSLVC